MHFLSLCWCVLENKPTQSNSVFQWKEKASSSRREEQNLRNIKAHTELTIHTATEEVGQISVVLNLALHTLQKKSCSRIYRILLVVFFFLSTTLAAGEHWTAHCIWGANSYAQFIWRQPVPTLHSHLLLADIFCWLGQGKHVLQTHLQPWPYFSEGFSQNKAQSIIKKKIKILHVGITPNIKCSILFKQLLILYRNHL